MFRATAVFLFLLTLSSAGWAQADGTVFAQPPVVEGPAAAPPPPPKPKPKPRPVVKWESPLSGTVLFTGNGYTLDWSSSFPEGTIYTVAMSRDGKTFTIPVADGTLETNVQCKPAGVTTTRVWLRVAATGPDGTLASDVIAVRILPRNAIIVSKANQRLWSLENGVVKHNWLVSTGKRDLDTRSGWFSVYLRSEKHHSREYDVDMPYALFFSGGQAIHSSTALRRLGSPASHGCVRLPRRNARTLFAESPIGRPVIVTPWGEDMRFLNGLKAPTKPPAKPKTAAAAVKPAVVAPPPAVVETPVTEPPDEVKAEAP